MNKDIEKQKNNNDINEENKLKEIKSAFYKFRIECLRTLINNNDSQKTINTKFVKEGLIEILQKYDEKINTNDTNLKYILEQFKSLIETDNYYFNKLKEKIDSLPKSS